MWPPRVHLAMSVDTFWVSRLGRHSWDLVGARDTASILQSTGCPLPPQGQGSSSPNSTCVEWRKLWFCCCSVITLCPTLWDPKDCGKPGSTVHYLPGLAQVLVHWVRDAISSSVAPFSFCLLSCPATESFPVSQLFAPGGQSIGFWASESILPMNIQSWFPLGLTDFISSLSKGLSRAFRSTTIWKSQFFSTHFLYGPTLTSVYDSWKIHSFDWLDLFRQSDVSAFEYTV